MRLRGKLPGLYWRQLHSWHCVKAPWYLPIPISWSLSHTHTTPAPPPLPPPKITNQRKRVHYSTDKVQRLRISSKNAWLVRAKTNLQVRVYWFPRIFPFLAAYNILKDFFFFLFYFWVLYLTMSLWFLCVSEFLLCLILY